MLTTLFQTSPMTLTRRRFLRLSAAATAAVAIPVQAYSQSSLAVEQLGSKKKGLGLGAKTPDWVGKLGNLRCKWVYTWTGAVPNDLPEGIGFIPMMRRKSASAERITNVAKQAKQPGITELFGLNEHDAQK